MIRAIGFVISSIAAGFLSGIFEPHVWGVRGAILGGMLAGGVLACDAYRKKKGALPGTVIVTCAVVISLAAFLLIDGWDTICSNPFGVPQATWHSFLTCFFISLGVLLGCRCHSRFAFFVIPLLSIIPRAIKFGAGMELGEILSAFFFFGIVGLLPFMLLWGCVAWRFGFFRKEPGNAGDCIAAGKEDA